MRADSKDIIVQKVTRCVIPPMTSRVAYVPNRVGEYYYRTDVGFESIEVEIVISESNQTKLRTKFLDISRWLNPLAGQKQLIFDDEPTLYYWAVLSQHADIDQLLAIGKTTLIFEIPDGVRHSLNQVLVDIGMKPPLTFTRSSSAYEVVTMGTLPGLKSVVVNAPRYQPSVYATGLQIEEGTTNIITKGTSLGASGNFTAVGTGTTISTVSAYRLIIGQGQSGSTMKCVTAGTIAGEGFKTTSTWAVTGGLPYTVSFYLLGKGTVKLQTLENDGSATVTNGTPITLMWDEYQRTTLTLTTQAGSTTIQIFVITTTEEQDVIYAQALQLEQKAYASSWQIGGPATRSEELCHTAPANSYILGQQGTIDFFFTKTTKPSSFGGMMDVGIFSLNSSRDRISIQHGTAIGSGERTIRFEIDSTANGGKKKNCDLTIPSNLVIGNPYYIACKWFLNGSVNGYQKITLADLTNSVEYSQIVTSTLQPPKFTASSTLYIGSLHNSSLKSNCIYSDIRFSLIPRNDTQITDTWTQRKPLLKDENSSIKFTFNNTLNGSVISNLGTATGYPEIRYYPSISASTFWLDIYPGPIRFQINPTVASSSDFRISSTQYTVYKPSFSTVTNSTLIALNSQFPVLTGDHYFVTNNTGAQIFLSYTPRYF